MKMIRAKLAAILLFGALGPASAAGKQSAPNIRYSTDKFDVFAPSLPPSFVGNSAADLYLALAKSHPPKRGEFETTSEFNERQIKFDERAFLGNISPLDTVAISIWPFAEEAYVGALKYDADASRMALHLQKAYFPHTCSLALENKSKQAGSYTGSNSFGVKAKVVKQEVTHLCLSSGGDVKIEFPLAREKAITLKPNLRILLVGRFTPPYTSQTHNYVAPTVTSPREIVHHGHILHMDITRVWVYDWTTGEVVYRPEM